MADWNGPTAECGCPLIVPPGCAEKPEGWVVIHYDFCEHHAPDTCLACKDLADGD